MSKQSERQAAINTLQGVLKPGDTVHTVVRHVSRSGMSRIIVPFLCGNKIIDGPRDISWLVARATDRRLDERGVKVQGCGMDMGFELVYNTSRALFPEGFECIGEDCPSNDHFNGDRNYEPHHHAEGGYALKQRWL